MKSKNMFIQERFQKIMSFLEKNGRATVDELSHYLYTSEATVRRDLSEMRKLGMIQRTHGGAMSKDNVDEVSIFVRAEKSVKEKQETARIAASHFPAFETIFIDNSSTCLSFVNNYDFSYKTVVTNGLQCAVMLSRKKNVKVIMLGGIVLYNTDSADGPLAIETLMGFQLDVMLASCSAFNKDGTFELSLDTRTLKQVGFKVCKKRLLLVDSTKIGKTGTYKTQDLSDYDMIFTDAKDDVLAPLKETKAKFFNH